MPSDFNTLRQLFLDYLQENKFEEEPPKLYEPINYIMDLGGKRVRPVSMMIAMEVFGGNIEAILPLAYAFELFHNFTLAHDDVMDEAQLRRGKEAVHIKFGLNSAILSGDAMLIYAYKIIMENIEDAVLRQKVLQLFSDTAIDICAGQQMDVDFEEKKEVELSSYLLMIKYKTAVLLAACLKTGALMGGASDEDADHLYAFGLNIGLAFQIQDDLLDLYADKSKFGKKIGGDVIQKKKTYLYLKALEVADADSKSRLLDVYNSDAWNDEEKIETVRSIFEELSIRDHAKEIMEELTENADDHLQSLSVGLKPTGQLKELSELLLKRIN
jgi:geranylgeranyl diphosphate synthase type II